MRIPLLFAFAAVISATSAADLPMKVLISGKAGEYTKEQWKTDWPGCEFEGGVSDGRVQVGEQDGLKLSTRGSFKTAQISH